VLLEQTRFKTVSGSSVETQDSGEAGGTADTKERNVNNKPRKCAAKLFK